MENEEMKYPVGTIIRVWMELHPSEPHVEYLVVETKRMVNSKTGMVKNLYKLKTIGSRFSLNVSKDNFWRIEKDLEYVGNSSWRAEHFIP